MTGRQVFFTVIGAWIAVDALFVLLRIRAVRGRERRR